jgi:hypothetical protein
MYQPLSNTAIHPGSSQYHYLLRKLLGDKVLHVTNLPQCIQSLIAIYNVGIRNIFNFHIKDIAENATRSLGSECVPVADFLCFELFEITCGPHKLVSKYDRPAIDCNGGYHSME